MESKKVEREELLIVLKRHVKETNIIKHMLSTEAVIRSLAVRFREDSNEWCTAGLMHDIEYDITAHAIKRQALKTPKHSKSWG